MNKHSYYLEHNVCIVICTSILLLLTLERGFILKRQFENIVVDSCNNDDPFLPPESVSGPNTYVCSILVATVAHSVSGRTTVFASTIFASRPLRRWFVLVLFDPWKFRVCRWDRGRIFLTPGCYWGALLGFERQFSWWVDNRAVWFKCPYLLGSAAPRPEMNFGDGDLSRRSGEGRGMWAAVVMQMVHHAWE